MKRRFFGYAAGAARFIIILFSTADARPGAAAGRVRILGTELTLHAMDRDTLIVTGRIAAVEYA